MKFEKLIQTGLLNFSVNMIDTIMVNAEVLKEQAVFPRGFKRK